ncbi:genetic competence negative regulator [Cytobacillus spongiae]|jgi:adapter protein MecA 1/2|uniref:genetic competence negative regulator n=1 Tax=Cytobacillus spongiae TaxID=2901381 RepID=UPI001F2B0044|nr:genetic competence negative regulator [Cytobacillus spongiae]UII54664.1 genetic competence negative regulator [Cytobacillus spongiae]
MRLERLNDHKIKIFLTMDDLLERGLTKEDIWKDTLKWHQLFHEMLEEASEEFGVELFGSVAVEIFSMQASGMIMIVTMVEPDDEESLADDFINMQASHQNEDLIFEFVDFEHVISLSKRLRTIEYTEGSLYHMDGNYYLYLDIPEEEINRYVSLLSEFGNQTFISIHRLMEYGKEIIKTQAVKTIDYFFK